MHTAIYVFGNRDLPDDSRALEVSERLKADYPEIEFKQIKPNEDFPFEGIEHVVIMDTVIGIEDPVFFTENDLEKVTLSPRNSVHDFDLGFQLRYLQKLGRLNKVFVIGIPYGKEITESLYNEIKGMISLVSPLNL